MSSQLIWLLSLLELTAGSTLQRRQDANNTATVDLAVKRGKPQHWASGFIYGIPDTPNQIPDYFYENMGFNYARAGGGHRFLLAAGLRVPMVTMDE